MNTANFALVVFPKFAARLQYAHLTAKTGHLCDAPNVAVP
jgi:hypothetical protein